VGAAVLGTQGEVVHGCNVESASYGLSCCAERVALFAAIAQAIKPVRLAVTCIDAPPESPLSSRTPCGACRQIILDLMGPNAVVEVDGAGTFTVSELLPHGFTLPVGEHLAEAPPRL
jgi:cytidine deaminase